MLCGQAVQLQSIVWRILAKVHPMSGCCSQEPSAPKETAAREAGDAEKTEHRPALLPTPTAEEIRKATAPSPVTITEAPVSHPPFPTANPRTFF